MEDKKIIQINNIKIKYNNIYDAFQCIIPHKNIIIEEFKEKKDAIIFAQNTFDYSNKVYEVTFWDYYDFEILEHTRKFNNKNEALEYANETNNKYSIFNTIIYFNNKELKF